MIMKRRRCDGNSTTFERVLFSNSMSFAMDLITTFESIRENSLNALFDSGNTPHISVVYILHIIRLYLSPKVLKSMPLTWPSVREILREPRVLLSRMRSYSVDKQIHPVTFQYALPFLRDRQLDLRTIQGISRTATQLGAWMWFVTFSSVNGGYSLAIGRVIRSSGSQATNRGRPTDTDRGRSFDQLSRSFRSCFKIGHVFYVAKSTVTYQVGASTFILRSLFTYLKEYRPEYMG